MSGKRASGMPAEVEGKRVIWMGAALLETLLLWLTLYLPQESWTKAGIFVFGTLLIWAFAYVGVKHTDKDRPSEPQPPHNLLCIGADLRRIYSEDGRLASLSFNYVGDLDTALAVVGIFANMPRTDRAVGPARGVRAIVAPVGRQNRIPSGYWLNSSHNSVDFETTSPARELVLVYVRDDGSVHTLEDRQESADKPVTPRHHTVFSAGHIMGGLSVSVQLASARGEVLNHSGFSVDLHPPHGRLPLDVVLFYEKQFLDGRAVDVDDADSPIWNPPNNEITPATERLTAAPPDVRLEGTFPGDFKLHARGDVSEIRTGPIVMESAIVGTHTDGGRTMPEVMPRSALEFPPVSGLCDDSKEAQPSLFCGQGFQRSGWPVPGADVAMKEFFRIAQFVRSRENGELDVTTLSEAELEKIAERRRQPHEFPFNITFWNGEHTQQWIRREVLVYEPLTNTAFVRHAGAPVPVPRPQEAGS